MQRTCSGQQGAEDMFWSTGCRGHVLVNRVQRTCSGQQGAEDMFSQQGAEDRISQQGAEDMFWSTTGLVNKVQRKG